MKTSMYIPTAFSVPEAFRLLSASVQIAGLGKTFKTLLITSAGSGEGKSVVTAALAAALAESGRHVVIVDANFKNPCQHKIWQINQTEESLTEFKELGNVSYLVLKDTRIKNLLLVPAGYLNLALGSSIVVQEINFLIDEVKKQAEIVLFDTSSILTSSDTPLLATKTDGVLLVVAAGMYKKETVKKAADLLGTLHVSIMGTVLNMADSPHAFNIGG